MALIATRPVPPRRPVRHRLVVRPRADWQEGIALTGKLLGSFVLFTSTMNWWFYRRTREDLEKNKDKK